MFVDADGRNHTVTFTLICSLFLVWGFCNGLIDVMDKHFQNTLHVSKAQSSMVQFANYMGYFLMALPAGMLARRIGYKGGILIGLGLIVAGALWFIPAIHIGAFWAFLTGLFILALGLACLETIANPYATVLGQPAYAAARINLAQSCNGVGSILGPVVGGHFIFSTTGTSNASNDGLFIPYLGIAVVVGVLAVVFSRARIPDVAAADDYHLGDGVSTEAPKSIWAHPHFVLAVAAQFLYVAAQTGIFSFFINYIDTDIPAMGANLAGHLPGTWTYFKDGSYRVTEFGASQLLAYVGFVLFLLGRFTGSAILRRFPAHAVLGIFAAVNTGMMILFVLHLGWVSAAALFLSFFFMSIMFPTVFALGIHGLGRESKKASSFIVMAIVGGAIMPRLMGSIADHYSMTRGFIVPLGCFAFVACYAAGWPRFSRSMGLLGVSTAHRH